MRKSTLLSILAPLALIGCAPEPDPAAGTVVPQPAELGTLAGQPSYAIDREFAGLVTPAQATDLGFELAGKTAQVSVDEGDSVKAGDPVAVLDTELLEDEREQLVAQRQELDAALKLNGLNRERIAELTSKGFASEQRADELDTERDSLTARRAQVQAALAANRTRLDKSVLRAPFDATVSRRFVDSGAVVNAGTPIFRLLESSQLEARIGVPVRMLPSLAVGQPIEIRVGPTPVPGTVIALGQDVTRATLTVPVRVALATEAIAVPGDQAYLTLPEQVEQAGFWVPLEALSEGMRGLWNIYAAVPDASSESFVLATRDVRVLYADGERAFVTGAIENSEQIVLSGVHRLVPGQ
ncbi:MAG: efflux RND transporter periplasmic adaptor subunit, partial [Pseudomonadota bacterium]